MPRLSRFALRVLDALTWRIRVLAWPQINELALDQGDHPRIEHVMATLLKQGWLDKFSLPVVLLTLDEPLFRSSPGETVEPNYGRICWQAHQRVTTRPLKKQTIYYATGQAQRRLGGVAGSIRQPFQLPHDLGTSSAFVTSRATLPDGAHWIGEDALRRYFRFLNLKKIPDAALVDGERIIRVIEFVGRDYSTRHLKRFHNYWTKKQTPYELW